PYSEPSPPSSEITRSTFWKSTQLNPISILVMKRNPYNKNMLVAGLSDIGCIMSLDNGSSWRMCNIPHQNSLYDIAFNPTQPNQIYAAASNLHDFPQDWHGDINNEIPGGIYASDDAGINWRLISPDTKEFINPYLSLAIDFKQNPCHMYAGTQGKGIIASFDCGLNWQRMNEGFEPMDSSTNSSDLKGSLIIPSIKISPKTQEVYALHTGNRLWKNVPNPYALYTGIYKLNKETHTWKQLGRPSVIIAPGAGGLYWKYPIDFAIDWANPNRMYLADMSTAGIWKIGGLWSTSDAGKTWVQLLQFDYPHKIYIQDDSTYLLGWADPGEPFLYKATKDNVFTPMDIRLPMQLVNDGVIDENGALFGTFGGGIFQTNAQN
ncbi:MAG: WD40/YVTN/BNR-like repeat-containing protein, partial [Legionellales bacterium]